MAQDVIARGMAATALKGLDDKASLVDGKVPASELPSYVDDVEEFADRAHFPEEGEGGKIYIALDTGLTYRWTGSTYVQIGGQDLSAFVTKNIITEEYDNTKTYNLYDYCIYNNTLYICTQWGGITTPEEFDPEHWYPSTIPNLFLDTARDQEIYGTKIFRSEGGSSLHTVSLTSGHIECDMSSGGYHQGNTCIGGQGITIAALNPRLSLIRREDGGQEHGEFDIWFDAENYNFNFTLYDDDDNFYRLNIPFVSGILATEESVVDSIMNNASKYQTSSVVVGNAITNINGRVFQNYTATLVTAGPYTFYQILKNGNNPTEDEAKDYMHYMTGSYFLPTYNYNFPRQTVFTFADRSTWKPQYSENDGLRLYRLTTPVALASDIHVSAIDYALGEE